MTASMSIHHLPNDSRNSNRTRAMGTSASPSSRRPYDVVKDAGPAANPIEFPPPTIHVGRRTQVVCYNHVLRSDFRAENVLFRDYDGNWDRVQRAYWPLPNKQPISTIMGHVSICLVLAPYDNDQQEMDTLSNADGDPVFEEAAMFQTTSEYVAIKVNYRDRMDRLRGHHEEDPLKEIAALQFIGNSHANILGCHEVLDDGPNINVVMPFCGSGDLVQLLQDHQSLNPDSPGLPEGEAKYWFHQVVTGLQYLHSIGVCHRDLSPENVMIDGHRCSIIDMGMCLRMPYTDPERLNAVTDAARGVQRRLMLPQGRCGKFPYMSPEIYRSNGNFDGSAIDVWTAGAILFVLLTGTKPYRIPHSSDCLFRFVTNKEQLSTLLNRWGIALSNEALDLLHNMLQVDPRKRLTIDEVMGHPWFSVHDEIVVDY